MILLRQYTMHTIFKFEMCLYKDMMKYILYSFIHVCVATHGTHVQIKRIFKKSIDFNKQKA